MKQYIISTTKTVSNNNQTQKIYSDFDLSNLTSVFLNGELQNTEDYLVKNNKVVFATNLEPEDKVTLHYVFDTNKTLLNPGKISKNALLSRYNTDIKLNENNKYTIGICIDKDIYSWQFNSKQNPMFTSSKKIYEDIGEFIEGFTEEYINNKIYDNSLAVINLIDELKENDVENVTYEIDEDGIYTSKYSAVSNWVRYKTDIDLTMARYFGISYRYGTELKEIGDIKIEKTTKLPYIDNLLEALKKKFDAADEIIKGVNVVASAVKAGTKYKYETWDRETTW